MASDIDIPPLYDPLSKQKEGKDYMADNWRDWFATFYQTLIGYLSQNGMFMPQLTTAQRDAIDSPQYGQMIYNTTIGSAQYYKQGSPDSWVSF